MPQENVAIIRSLYEAFARGDVPVALGHMQPDIVWYEAEGNAYADGNPYRGPEAVLSGVFARLVGEWDGFTVEPQEFLDAGDTVVVLGRYKGTYKATGRAQDAQMAHIWRLRDGKIAGFQQLVDTLHLARVTGAA